MIDTLLFYYYDFLFRAVNWFCKITGQEYYKWRKGK